MIVKCLYQSNATIPKNIIMNNNSLCCDYDVIVGENYEVFAQSIYCKNTMYLIDPRKEIRPNWYPAELFSIVDGNIPDKWLFNFYPGMYGSDLGALWGYKELIQNDQHYNELIERDPIALNIFQNYCNLLM